MANRTTYLLSCLKNETQLLTAKLAGAGAADMTLPEAANSGGGEVASAVRTGAGAFTLTFRKKYPALLSILRPGHLGTTAGLTVRFLTLDPAAGTATIVCEVGAVATDPAVGDFLFLNWLVRNTGRNA